jgi:hypothetical protein
MTNAERQQRFREGHPKPRSKTMNEQRALRPEAPRMPISVEEYSKLRALKYERTINDFVEDIHLKLIEDQRYNDLLHAIYPEHAVEKSLWIDDVLAAQMIREYANDHDLKVVTKENLAVIIKAMHVVQKRYKATREIRRNTVGGVKVTDAMPDENNHPRQDDE